MKPESIQKINQSLLQQTSIDFSRYRNQELLETIANAATFPLFFARSISRPIVLLIILTLLAVWISDSAYFKSFLVFPGLVLAVINGILLGLVIFIRRIRNDMTSVFAISSDLCVQVLKDISAARMKLSGDSAGFPSLREIFHGVNAVVVLPMLIQTLEQKIPFLGGLAARVTERFFNIVDRRLTASIKTAIAGESPPVPQATAEQMSNWLQSAERLVNTAKENISTVVRVVSRVVAFPFVAVLTIVFLLSAAIVYSAYAMLG
jgi:hypothetical protein